MPDVFAAIEARVNRAVATHLRNAQLVFAGGAVDVVFGAAEEMQRVPGGLGNHARGGARLGEWQAGAPAADFAGVAPADGMACQIGGVEYRVTRAPVTDASGWMMLSLRRAV